MTKHDEDALNRMLAELTEDREEDETDAEFQWFLATRAAEEAELAEEDGTDDDGDIKEDENEVALDNAPVGGEPPLDLLIDAIRQHRGIKAVTLVIMDHDGQIAANTAGASMPEALLMAEVARHNITRRFG